jgi:hypothetical protein
MAANPTFKKREKERARQERQREKDSKRKQRREDKKNPPPEGAADAASPDGTVGGMDGGERTDAPSLGSDLEPKHGASET